ncbi:MAG: hypothetical protein SGI98_13200 [Verrucomicrobiota bacterium]|nr:hypothetical protein [Verrucomicrobiota bacterium]
MENEQDKLWEIMGRAKKLDPSPWFTEQVLRRVERIEQVRVEYISFPKFFWKFATAFGVFAIAGAIFFMTPPDQMPVSPTPTLVQVSTPVPTPLISQVTVSQPLIETSKEDQQLVALTTNNAVVSLPDASEAAWNPAIQTPAKKVHDLNLIQTGFETASGLGTQDF